MLALTRRPLRPMLRGVLVLAFVGAAALIVVHILGVHTATLGDSVASLVANLFAWENWHLLWYLVIFLLLLYRGRRWSNGKSRVVSRIASASCAVCLTHKPCMVETSGLGSVF